MNVDVKNHMSSISEEDKNRVKQAFQKTAAARKPEKGKQEAEKEPGEKGPTGAAPARDGRKMIQAVRIEIMQTGRMGKKI